MQRSDTQTANPVQDSANTDECSGIPDAHPISQLPAWGTEQSPLLLFRDFDPEDQVAFRTSN